MSMSELAFFDTNILVYTHDRRPVKKRHTAQPAGDLSSASSAAPV